MKTKKLFLKSTLILAIGVLFSNQINGQITGTGDAFLKGNYVEIGIEGTGGHEGNNSTPLLGMHQRGAVGLFGFVSNPQMNSWATFDGDFFTPGSPENGWGIKIGSGGTGLIFANNPNITYSTTITGSVTAWAHPGTITTVDWEGTESTTGLKVNINYSLGDNDLFYITTVTVTNTSSLTVNNIYYYRNLDPDNNQSLTGDFSTTQNLISQYGSCLGCYAQVSSTQTTPWTSLFSFLASDSIMKAGYGGFSNRDGEDMYTGSGFVQTIGATNTADEAIHLSYKINSLIAGASHKSATTYPSGSYRVFRFASVFKATAVASAQNAMQTAASVGINELVTKNNAVSIYPNPMNDNATITVSSSIKLSNAEFQIYDVIGKLIKASPLNSNEFTFEKGNLSSGLYFYKLINNGSELSTGKFLVK